MDFDDMPDSYFAFLSNQRKLAEPDKINGAVRELARGGETPTAKGKVKSRASQPNLAAIANKPSVPSLPSIQRQSAAPPANAAHHSSGHRLPAGRTNPSSAPSGSRPPAGVSTQPSGSRLAPPHASAPQLANMSMRMQANGPAVAAPGKSNAVVFVLVGVLVAAIVVLAYLVLKK
jgi:hypothetical protein